MISSASMFSMTKASQSEEFCKIISVATIKENTEGLNRMHAARRVDNDVNLILSRGYITKVAGGSDADRIHIELFICVDKKAVEVFRGCAPGCPWCECTADSRLATAWKASDIPPTSWSAAEAKLKKVCKCPFPSAFDCYAYAHKALPMEKLPRHCKFCGCKPYKTEKEYAEHCALIERERSDVSKEGKAAFQRKRSAHAAKHARQYLHETSSLLVSMCHVIVEVMHLIELNVAKQCWTKAVVSLMSPYMRDMATQFFKGMEFKLDVKLKANGQSGTAWFKASVVNELVHGSTKVPGGLAPWMASLLFFVGEDFLAKQTAIRPLAGDATDSDLEILKKRYGVKGQQLYNSATLWDCYKEWHDTMFLATPDATAREEVALQMAIAANAMMEKFKTVATESGKTWIFHIALYIAPRQVFRCASPSLPCLLLCSLAYLPL